MRRWQLLLIFLFVTLSLSAQKMQKVCGEYIYHTPENVSIEEAKRTALEHAKLVALANEYGTIIAQNNSTIIKNANGESDVDFLSLSSSEVKGEWIETTGVPDYEIVYDQGELVVKVSVCGTAREIVSTGVSFKAKLLRNGLDERFESEEFQDGDDFYLWFQSPMDGYLAVFLIDDSQTVYCLLPYMRSKEGIARINHGEKCLFFSSQQAKSGGIIVDEYILTCRKSVEYNQIYVIFSPNLFTKIIDEYRNKEGTPCALDYKEFQKWLVKCRNGDRQMKVEVKNLTIRK